MLVAIPQPTVSDAAILPERIFPTGRDRLATHAQRIAATGDPLATPPEQERPTLGQTWRAAVGTTIVQDVIDMAVRPRFEREDDFFLPDFFDANRHLRDDPLVQTLRDLGQFDGVWSEGDFHFELARGRRYLEDLDTLSRASLRNKALAIGGTLIGDPTNLLPFGAAFKLAKSGTTLGRAAQFAAIAGTISVGFEELQNTLNPASDERGPINELATFGIGASLGAGVGFLTSPAVLNSLSGHIPTRKVRQMQRDWERLATEPVVRKFDPANPAVDPIRLSLADEVARGKASIQAALADDPVDNRVVSAIHVEGDESATLIQQLRTKYQEAGKALHVIEHPDQPFANLLDDVRTIIDHSDAQAAATSAELGGNWIDRAFGAVTSRYAALAAVVTPQGRLARTTLGRLHDVNRTLSGSARTVTKASADNAFGFASGTAAESVAHIYDAAKEAAVIGLRREYRALRSTQNPTYNGQPIAHRFDYHTFRNAAYDLMRREHAKSRGFDVEIPTDVPQAVRDGAERVRGYFARMRDEAEGVNLLHVGPRALAVAKREVDSLTTRVAKLQRALDGAADDPILAARLRPRFEKAQTALDDANTRLSTIDKAVAGQRFYLPRVWIASRIVAQADDFKRRIADSFRRNDSIVDGSRVADDARPLIPEAVEHLDRAQVENIIAAKTRAAEAQGAVPAALDAEDFAADVAQLTEGDLPADLRTAYRAELDAYYRRHADSAFDTLTKPDEAHGVEDALPSPIRRRILTIDEADFAEYLETDLEVILERYNRVVGGRTAVRRAIQLNPEIWRDARLRDGRAITDGADMMAYLRETADTMEQFAAKADATAGRTDTSSALMPTIRRLKGRIERDIGLPLSLMEGRNPITQDRGVFAAFSYFGRQLLRLSYANKLGSIAWAQSNDLAPSTLYAMQRPGTLGLFPRAIFNLKSLPRRDLETLGLMFDGVTRARALSDVDYLASGSGFGEGQVRRATARIERGMERLGDIHSRLSMMTFITDINKRVAGGMVIDRMTDNARRLLHAHAIMGGGMSEAKALRKAGLNSFDAAKLNSMGLNAQRARHYLTLVHRHGLTPDDVPISEVIPDLETFLTGDIGPLTQRVLKPNFAEWQMDPATPQGKANRDLHDILTANVASEVHHGMIVTPGHFDKPHVNRTVLGRIFNQFQTFLMAFANQRLAVMAQMPAHYQGWYAMAYLFLGSLSDAISNHLSGRRSLDETIEQWQKNPLGMTYAAFERSGLSGWLARPLAIADSLGIPFSPGNLVGNPLGSSAARHVTPGRALTFFGPAAADVDRFAQVLAGTARGDFDQQTLYNAAKLLPFQNLIWLRLLHSTTGAPIVPEAIWGDQNRRQPMQ